MLLRFGLGASAPLSIEGHTPSSGLVETPHPANRQGLECLAMESSYLDLTSHDPPDHMLPSLDFPATPLLRCRKQFIQFLPSFSDLDILDWIIPPSLEPVVDSHIRELILHFSFGTNLTPHPLQTAANVFLQEIIQLLPTLPDLENFLPPARHEACYNQVVDHRGSAQLRHYH